MIRRIGIRRNGAEPFDVVGLTRHNGGCQVTSLLAGSFTTVYNMEKMCLLLSLSPLVVILSLFVSSSQAIWCHKCDARKIDACNIPFNKDSKDPAMQNCQGTLCRMRMWKEDGRFMIIFSFVYRFTST